MFLCLGFFYLISLYLVRSHPLITSPLVLIRKASSTTTQHVHLGCYKTGWTLFRPSCLAPVLYLQISFFVFEPRGFNTAEREEQTQPSTMALWADAFTTACLRPNSPSAVVVGGMVSSGPVCSSYVDATKYSRYRSSVVLIVPSASGSRSSTHRSQSKKGDPPLTNTSM